MSVLDWTRVSRYAFVSRCERYSVAKVMGPDGWQYETWKRAPRTCLARHDTPDEAFAHAQEFEDRASSATTQPPGVTP